MKPDPGHLETEEVLKRMEKEISSIYKQAANETTGKLKDYLRRFEKKDKKWQEWVKDGTKKSDEYKKWRIGQMIVGNRWQSMKDQLTKDMVNADKIARSIAKGYQPEVYAINHNYATYEIEHGARIGTSYTLYNRETVERLIRDDPKLLPDPAPGSETARKIAENKDYQWNSKHIQSAMIQGILQGESIPKLSRRLERVAEMDHKAAIRYARTMTTGVQNAGRVDGYERAQEMGIDLEQQWVATLDDRTRHSHRQLDGEHVPIGEVFSNGCKFPGDPDGEPEEVYNCRCTLISYIKGFERDLSDLSLRRDEKLGDMSYEEWKEKHGSSDRITKQEEISGAMKKKYIDEYRK